MNCKEKMNLHEITGPISNELELFEAAYLTELDSEADFLHPLSQYIGAVKGKRLRPILFFLSQGLIAKPRTESIQIAVLLELLHTATLIHDDIVDDSSERRGRKSVNGVWGNQVSVLFGDYLFAKVLSIGVQSHWREVLKIISNVVLNLGKGELRQAMQDVEKKFSMAEYFQVILEKTAGFFIAAGRLAGVVLSVSEAEKDRLCRLGEYFGMAFQIRDDILDFSGQTKKLGKPIGQDVYNGKVTLPLIMALEGTQSEERESILQSFKNGAQENRKWIVQFVEDRGGIGKAQDKAREFIDRAREILFTFSPSPYRDAFERLMLHDLERVG